MTYPAGTVVRYMGSVNQYSETMDAYEVQWTAEDNSRVFTVWLPAASVAFVGPPPLPPQPLIGTVVYDRHNREWQSYGKDNWFGKELNTGSTSWRDLLALGPLHTRTVIA